MSMNFKVYAERNVIVAGYHGNDEDVQTVFYPNMQQTPTKLTEQLLNSQNPFETYCQWLVSKFVPFEVEFENDFTGKTETYLENDGPTMVRELREWKQDMEQQGFTISYCSM